MEVKPARLYSLGFIDSKEKFATATGIPFFQLILNKMSDDFELSKQFFPLLVRVCLVGIFHTVHAQIFLASRALLNLLIGIFCVDNLFTLSTADLSVVFNSDQLHLMLF
jgi:hypothetical protein